MAGVLALREECVLSLSLAQWAEEILTFGSGIRRGCCPEPTTTGAREVRQELVTDARHQIDVLETSDSELAVKYRAQARLRQDDPIGR